MLSIIAALNENYVIGNENKLIWHISDDLKRFKKLTTGKTIIMGRKTFESLPGVLPNRKHIVITKNLNYSRENVSIVHSIDEIIELKDTTEENFIIGGGEIYRALIPYCSILYLTKVHSNQTGDAFFPKFDENDYSIIATEKHGDYDFVTFKRR
ncbi:dihydrofolate reductase [Clostridium acetobutylicum]|uniref:Dihydrofolate reductase n=1 Tax=Clostridium acetobutylicum (strain ATCC 824 / DSM 792 / JCM 1419 / IAM 19013 / LMG 5710 / NBRC 13948 / NRRL B-527 / VKM B-1787 / 2291 / W) TaxID=272562 RepID=Q97EV2_CLOAB|nr:MULTISPECIES: dihydrofolate reductase [Clostridium]AAK80945.1 Dihydrofolate reductase [Clostridium acetobutylicum ATCC 824]ADZ22047.1 Dihydrofolate reductase [Clostridium acetobutylicum EA 2018]AEI34342.1 dihydrofolate reductase [Clostridium acetobutylicum DSM 1731]AWV78644.1 dihydrofolate reductase [Clostridium acetobutylicum]MBC2393505.1 dihydrofolate reductase [Clostridium acetobutylicum]